MAHQLHRFANSVLAFFFPPFCACCRQLIGDNRTTLCQACFDSLRLIDPTTRCRRCGFSLDAEVHRCHTTSLEDVNVCFDDGPVIRTLLNRSAEQIAPFVIVQWHALKWPLPDFVMPTPGDWFSRGTDRWRQRQEIAAQVATILGKPISRALTMRRHRLPTPYLSLEGQGKEMDDSLFSIRRPHRFVNKTVLLIHDTLISGRALRASASALSQHGARAVFGISVM
jgi:predicted amidophosphoribosyltransferase